MTVGGSPARPRRSDAQRNRALLVSAARAVFAERGVEASVEEIVARAGVGTGTLYRHFPNREALVDALFAERAGEIVDAVAAAAAEKEPARALALLVERMVALQLRDPLFKELFTTYPPDEDLVAGLRAEVGRLSEIVLSRARGAGVLRPDFTVADLALLFWSLGPILEATGEVAPRAWRRHVGFVLDGLVPAAASPAPVPPLRDDELAAAMRSLRAQRFHRGAAQRSGAA